MTETDSDLTEEPAQEPVQESAGVFARWSRNKSNSRSGDGQEISQPETDSTATRDPSVATGDEAVTTNLQDERSVDSELADVAAEETSEEELILTDEDMPAIETLNADSDYSGFLNKGVSPELRRKALQHLFRMPKFNIRDGLNDYDEDYTYFEPLGDTITSDMRWHTARKEREAREAEEARIAASQDEQSLESEVVEADSPDTVSADDQAEESVDDVVSTEAAEIAEVAESENATEVALQSSDPEELDDAGTPVIDEPLAIRNAAEKNEENQANQANQANKTVV